MIDVIEFIKARLLYRSNQRLSRPEFERRRLVRFREFAAFVKTNSPYYRRIMEGASHRSGALRARRLFRF